MSALRMLLPGPVTVGDLDLNPAEALQALGDLYAYPVPVGARGWVRASMVTTLDGAAAGPDGRSGSISGRADRAVFGVLRALADVIVVGARTARSEDYRLPVRRQEFAERRAAAGQRPAAVLAVVTRSGRLPGRGVFDESDPDSLLITCAEADVEGFRGALGDRVIVAGTDRVDPAAAMACLVERGLGRILVEGGPELLGQVAAAQRLDELCLTLTPRLIAGQAPRLALGPAADLPLRCAHLVECDGALLGRWVVRTG